MKHTPEDPRRAANIRTGLLLLAAALAFFAAVLLKYEVFLR